MGAAREKVRVAHALKDLPKISDSFRQGQISFSKVRAMTRVATPENEEYLMMIARHGTAAHMEQLVRYFRKVKRIEALEAENQRHELREMNWHIDDDGSYVIKARLTPEQGERVLKAVESAMDEEFNERKNVSTEDSSPPADCPVSEPVAQRRADALARVAEGFLGSEPAPMVASDRPFTYTPISIPCARTAKVPKAGWIPAHKSPRKRPDAWPAIAASCTGTNPKTRIS